MTVETKSCLDCIHYNPVAPIAQSCEESYPPVEPHISDCKKWMSFDGKIWAERTEKK